MVYDSRVGFGAIGLRVNLLFRQILAFKMHVKFDSTDLIVTYDSRMDLFSTIGEDFHHIIVRLSNPHNSYSTDTI